MNTQSSARYYPAEWEKQNTVWLSWPHNEKEWGNKRLKRIKEFYKKLIQIILKFQNVNLIIPDEEFLEETSNSISQQKYKLKKIIIPNNDIWIRDYGPFFMKNKINKKGRGEATSPLLLDFEFNAWGGKFPPWNYDNKVPKEIASYTGSVIESYPVILEGGALEFSGNGLILTTEECVLNKNRNAKLKKAAIEKIIKDAFNIEEILWLKHGLANDHTDGHIDNVARFIDKRTVLICSAEDKRSENYERLKPSIELLKKHKKLKTIELLLPNVSKDLPASYANFIFVNGGIILPTFNCKNDEKALLAFKKLFPKRQVVGIDSSLLIEEGGGIHCMSKQECVS